MAITIHPVAEMFPALSDNELKDLAESIRTNGLVHPIIVQRGVLLDGRNRLRACKLAGVAPRYEEYDGKDPVGLILAANVHRRHLSETQRAMIAAQIAKLQQGRPAKTENRPIGLFSISQPDAADALGISHRTMRRAAAVVKHGTPALVEACREDKIAVSRAAEIAKLPQEKQGKAIERELSRSDERPHVAHNSGQNEWYTPRDIIDAAREVMGGIDLDPASTATANKVVGATRYYTAEDDGLSKKWVGRIWMNPPYAAGLVDRFANALAEHVRSGSVTEAVVLVNNATETEWFTTLAGVASALCFPRGRVRFWRPDETSSAPLQGQCLLYCGENTKRFISAFGQRGIVAMVHHARRSG